MMMFSAQSGIFLPEWFVWIVGLLLLPGIGWCIFMAGSLRGIHHKLDALQAAVDQYGFGTGGMKKLIEDNARAIRALIHYIKWAVRSQTGEDAPPPIPDLDP